MSYKEQREKAIIEYLREHKEATVGELCRMLYVSEPTMRRDLAALGLSGRIIRTHGGAVYRSELGENLPFSYREREHSDEKAAIAKKCLSLVKDGDVIMVDGSSSAIALLRLIDVKKSIVVVTNSAKAALVLAETNIKTFVTGGELSADTYAYVGSHAEEFVKDFNADLCFFSVRRLTADGRLTDNALGENRVRRAMLSVSEKSVLLLDSQKLGEPCLNTLCHIKDVDFVVSEGNLAEKFPEYSDKFM
ncbi:MAG: DeoR/GlpR transcriptional regulator [Clostridia bacterium]|nr:DeoR/GlpR transcriptional regulator [Clostridia bacterium]